MSVIGYIDETFDMVDIYNIKFFRISGSSLRAMRLLFFRIDSGIFHQHVEKKWEKKHCCYNHGREMSY